MKTRIRLLLVAWSMLGASAAVAQKPAPFGLPGPTAQTPAPPSSPAGKSTGRAAAGGALYIAGDGFTLERAIEDGLREREGNSGFAVLVLGAEISKLGIHGATSETSAVILKATRGGGSLFVCARDVKRQNFASHEFVPGVRIITGFSKAESEAANAGRAASSPREQRMRSLCAE